MILSCILLALSLSIDSIGIEITYGIKNTKINIISNIILFTISFCITCGSIFLGHYISILLSPNFSKFLGSSFLILLGIYNIYKTINNKTKNYDIDNSNTIDKMESIILGFALSIDSACVGLGSGIIGINDIILPILVSSFQLFFINCGNFFGKSVISNFNISENIISMFSGIILIIVALFRIVF